MYNQVKSLYKEKFNIDGDLIDLLADYEIMYYCATGLSNKVISELTMIDIEEIKQVLQERFNFNGWYTTLDFSPIFIYNKTKGIDTFYYKAVKTAFNDLPSFIIKKSFEVCKKFIYYEDIIDRNFN